MLATQKVSKKRNKMTMIGIIVVLAITAVLLYIIFSPPVTDESLTGALTPPAPAFSTTIDTSILEDDRLQSLKQYGPSEVEVLGRGRNVNPFIAF